MRKRKGQSSLEYVIVLMAIIAAVIVGVTYFAKPGDASKDKGVSYLIDKATDKITGASGKLPR